MNRLIFLGTGGGKHMMFSQVRRTGGIFVELDNTRFVIDPGPGSLVYSQALKLRPDNWNGILLSHIHPDHFTDVNALLDGMNKENKEYLFLIAEEHCLSPKKDFECYPCVTRYHQELVKELHPLKPGRKIKIGNLEFIATRADHYVPTLGFRINGTKSIGYASDGTYYNGQEEFFDGCDILILNVLVPKGEKSQPMLHMSVDEAISLLKAMKKKPAIAVLQHLSFWMLRSNLFKQTKIVKDATKASAITAEDFMEIDLDKINGNDFVKILKP